VGHDFFRLGKLDSMIFPDMIRFVIQLEARTAGPDDFRVNIVLLIDSAPICFPCLFVGLTRSASKCILKVPPRRFWMANFSGGFHENSHSVCSQRALQTADLLPDTERISLPFTEWGSSPGATARYRC